MNQFVPNQNEQKPIKFYEGDSGSELKNGSNQNNYQFKVLLWLACAVFVFSLLFGSSLLALLWLPPYAGMNVRSNLVADYSPWAYLQFQPVDPAIFIEISNQRGLPEEIVIDGEGWSTPIREFSATPVTKERTRSTFQPTIELTDSTSTAIQPAYTGTPIPTSIIPPSNPTATPHLPPVANPTKSHKPAKTPKTPRQTKSPRP